jgi:hypothetical protein
MDATHTPPTDAAALVAQLDPDAIRQRLDALDRERSALLVLLRAAIRARSQRREEDDGHATR